jgi:hypothetical protein
MTLHGMRSKKKIGDIFIFTLPIFLTTFSTHIFFISFWLVLAKKKREEAVAQHQMA